MTLNTGVNRVLKFFLLVHIRSISRGSQKRIRPVCFNSVDTHDLMPLNSHKRPPTPRLLIFTAGPSRAGLSTAGASTAGLSRAGLSTAGPSRAGPSTACSKDVNTVNIGLLLERLQGLRFNTALVLWIKDFFKDRPQHVRLCGFKTNSITVNTGDPQGCVQSYSLSIQIKSSVISVVCHF